MELIRVANTTDPRKLAGSLSYMFNGDVKEISLRAVGANATNRMIKAIAICRGYLAQSGSDIVCIPIFDEVKIDEAKQTAIKIIIRRN